MGGASGSKVVKVSKVEPASSEAGNDLLLVTSARDAVLLQQVHDRMGKDVSGVTIALGSEKVALRFTQKSGAKRLFMTHPRLSRVSETREHACLVAHLNEDGSWRSITPARPLRKEKKITLLSVGLRFDGSYLADQKTSFVVFANDRGMCSLNEQIFDLFDPESGEWTGSQQGEIDLPGGQEMMKLCWYVLPGNGKTVLTGVLICLDPSPRSRTYYFTPAMDSPRRDWFEHGVCVAYLADRGWILSNTGTVVDAGESV